tara:strand:+ start:315 stop:827 length:513 start_codon:yes stop_codon:yes gene_type:complete
VRVGRFREDLLYRLKVVPIKLPPLRERTSDIPHFVKHFIQVANRRNGRNVLGVREEAMRILNDYPWPGNVRQLANVVEQMVVLTRNDSIAHNDVPVDLIDWRSRDETSTMDFANFKEARAVFERRFLCNALRRHNGVIAQVAEAIGMSRKNLYIKLETLDIDYDRYRKCS